VSTADKVGITDFEPSSSDKAAVPHYANRRRTSFIKLINYYAGTKARAKPTQLYWAVRAFYKHGHICPRIPCEQVGSPRLEFCASNDILRMLLKMVKRTEKAPSVNCATADAEQNQANADTYYVTQDTHDGFMVCSTHSFNELFQSALPKNSIVLAIRLPKMSPWNVRLENSQFHLDNIFYPWQGNAVRFRVQDVCS